MSQPSELELLYLEAKRLIKAKEFSLASTLLKQILEGDEGYKDASRLLASIVLKKRYRWYKDLRIWGGIAALGIVGMLITLLPQLLDNLTPANPSPASTDTSEIILQPTLTSTIIPTPTSDPNVGRFEWKRVNSAREIERDMVNSLAVYLPDHSIMYAATVDAGIYKTIDGGQSWSPLMNGLEEASYLTILVNYSDPALVIALSSKGILYSSSDGGGEWEKVTATIGQYTQTIAQDPIDRDHLIAKIGDELYESLDFGSFWEPISSPVCPQNIDHMVINEIENAEIIAFQQYPTETCPGMIYRSIDAGKTWIDTGFVASEEGGNQLQTVGEYIYTLAGPSAYFYVSPDKGKTWRGPITAPSRCNGFEVDPKDGKRVFCVTDFNNKNTSDVLYSEDEGKTWLKIATLDIFAKNIYIPEEGSHTLYAFGRGLATSGSEGQTWETKQSGLGARINELVFDPTIAGHLYIHETDCLFNYSDVFSSTDGGVTINQITALQGIDACGLIIGHGGILYRFGWWDIFSSSNQGAFWAKMAYPLGNNFITALGANPKVAGFLLASISPDDATYRSLDAGLNWTMLSNHSGHPEYFFFAGENGTRLFSIHHKAGVFRSDDAGESWVDCNLPPLAKTTSSLAVDSIDIDTIYLASQGNGVLKSTDGCLSTQKINNGLDNVFVNTIAVDPNDPQRLFAGTSGGAYVSLNGGESWFQVNDGLLGATIIYSIAINPTDSSVYASTPYGIFKLIEN